MSNQIIADRDREIERLERRVAEVEAENTLLHRVIENLAPPSEGFGECFDDLIADGIIIPVPSDDAFKDEFGADADTMHVYRWSELARKERHE